MTAATVTSKGQLTIPADIRDEFGIEPGHRVVFFKQLDGELGIKLIKLKKGSGAGILSHYAGRAEGTDLDAAIENSVSDGVAARLEGRDSG
jgi:antitoxin PrlF